LTFRYGCRLEGRRETLAIGNREPRTASRAGDARRNFEHGLAVSLEQMRHRSRTSSNEDPARLCA
jgi:hypothetical protein